MGIGCLVDEDDKGCESCNAFWENLGNDLGFNRICPECGYVNHIVEIHEDSVYCNCGYRARFDEYGQSMPDAYKHARENVPAMVVDRRLCDTYCFMDCPVVQPELMAVWDEMSRYDRTTQCCAGGVLVQNPA